MTQTAMQEVMFAFHNSGRTGFSDWIKENEFRLLELQKKQIVEAHISGQRSATNDENIDSEEYYTKTYKP